MKYNNREPQPTTHTSTQNTEATFTVEPTDGSKPHDLEHLGMPAEHLAEKGNMSESERRCSAVSTSHPDHPGGKSYLVTVSNSAETDTELGSPSPESGPVSRSSESNNAEDIVDTKAKTEVSVLQNNGAEQWAGNNSAHSLTDLEKQQTGQPSVEECCERRATARSSSSEEDRSSQRESRAYTSTDSQGTDVSVSSWSFVKIVDLAELRALRSDGDELGDSVNTGDDSVFHQQTGPENRDLFSPDTDDVFAFTSTAQVRRQHKVSGDSDSVPTVDMDKSLSCESAKDSYLSGMKAQRQTAAHANDDCLVMSEPDPSQQKYVDSIEGSVLRSTTDKSRQKSLDSKDDSMFQSIADMSRHASTDAYDNSVFLSTADMSRHASTDAYDNSVFLSTADMSRHASTDAFDNSVFLSNADTATQTASTLTDDCVFLPEVTHHTPDTGTVREVEGRARSLPRRIYRSHIRHSPSLANLLCRDAKTVLDQQYRMAAELNLLRHSFHLPSERSADSNDEDALNRCVSSFRLHSTRSAESQPDDARSLFAPRHVDECRSSSSFSTDNLLAGTDVACLHPDSRHSSSLQSCSLDSMTTNPSRSVLCQATSVSMITRASSSDLDLRPSSDSASASFSSLVSDGPFSSTSSPSCSVTSRDSSDVSRQYHDAGCSTRNAEGKSEHNNAAPKSRLLKCHSFLKSHLTAKDSFHSTPLSSIVTANSSKTKTSRPPEDHVKGKWPTEIEPRKPSGHRTEKTFDSSACDEGLHCDKFCRELSGSECNPFFANSQHAQTTAPVELDAHWRGPHSVSNIQTCELRERFYTNSHLHKVLGSEDSFKASTATAKERAASQGSDHDTDVHCFLRAEDQDRSSLSLISADRNEPGYTDRDSKDAMGQRVLETSKPLSSLHTKPGDKHASYDLVVQHSRQSDQNRLVVKPLFGVVAATDDRHGNASNKEKTQLPMNLFPHNSTPETRAGNRAQHSSGAYDSLNGIGPNRSPLYSCSIGYTSYEKESSHLRKVVLLFNAGLIGLVMVGFQALYRNCAANVQRLKEVVTDIDLCTVNSSKTHSDDLTSELVHWEIVQADVQVAWLTVLAAVVLIGFSNGRLS
ncbi:hypothetical protein V1264_008683 [Littorina saxatilis]|uniref:Uncharacterized protein n=1 Tax=Littorina saxatilis TaxID=31220 RepID=A0AAN9ATJ8_9CAEN